MTNPSLPEQWALLVEPRYKQLCEILFKSFFMFSFIFRSRTRPLSKPSMVATWEKVHGDLLGFFFLFFRRTSSSEQKESLLKSLASFLPRPRSNTVCEMRVAWVWLFQKASAHYCLPSQLLQAPAPWLPYMRDQGLPRCFWERRAQCETGQTSPQNTHFLCMLGALVGIRMGSLTQQLGLGFFFFLPSLFLMATVAFLFRGLRPLSAACTVWNSIISWVCPKESLFRLWLFIRWRTEAPHVEKVKVILSTSHSCQKVQSLSHGINLYSNKIKIYSSWGLA